MMGDYLGHPMTFWLELKLQVDKLGSHDIIRELADLRSKVAMYESHYDRLQTEKEVVDGET